METKNLSAALYTTVKQSGQIARYANHPEVAVRIDILEQFARLTRDNNIPVKRAASDCNVGLSTIYRWHHNYRKKGLGGLVNGSRRPHRCRQRQSNCESNIRIGAKPKSIRCSSKKGFIYHKAPSDK